MSRILLLPVAASALLLTACVGAAPTPTPDATATRSSDVTAEPTPEPTPITVGQLPAGAFLQASVTAVAADGSELRIQVTVRPPRSGAAAEEQLQAVLEACPNAVASQLDVFPGMEPTGVVVSEIVATGDWPADEAVGISAGAFIANLGVGDVMAPADDPDTGFGCTIPALLGPGQAETYSLLLGDPAVPDAQDVQEAVARGVFGVQESPFGGSEVTWRDCIVQLGPTAERLMSTWYPPAEWGRGCLVGYGGGA